MRAVVHVHQAKMRKGEPSIIVRTYKGSKHYREIQFTGPARLVQLKEPDHCGARVIIETDTKYIQVRE